ncbi:hypothetical protein BDF19DRAFT_182899 [Syncephalis fuscata]|nr:hypothetical protein BDF19DRAFT_182899 [Syncephalis fuscata]
MPPHHHHNPSSVVDNYDEHVEEDIAKAMAEFVETDLADNTSATTNAIGMAMTSAINPMAAWVHNESDQHKKHDNNEESLLAVLTSNALQSSSSSSSSPPPPSSSSSISHQQQQQDYHDELTISNQMNYSMEALPLNTPLSNALPMIQTNQSNIENELGLPFSSNNSVQDREDSREPLSQSISLDWNTVTAEQLKNDLSWDALIRLEAEVQKAMRLYDNQNEQSTDNNNRQPVKVATTATTSLPIAVNRNTLRGRSIASNPSNNTIKRSNQPHRQILNSDALSATSARSTSPSVVSAATSSARSEVPRVRLLPAPLPVSKSINHTSNSSQLHRSLRSASATASTVSSSGSTVPNAKFFPAAFTSAATSTAIDRAKPSTGRSIASTTHRRIVSASTIPQPMPILLPSPSLPILQPAIPSVSTDIKRTTNNKRSNGTTDMNGSNYRYSHHGHVVVY